MCDPTVRVYATNGMLGSRQMNAVFGSSVQLCVDEFRVPVGRGSALRHAACGRRGMTPGVAETVSLTQVNCETGLLPIPLNSPDEDGREPRGNVEVTSTKHFGAAEGMAAKEMMWREPCRKNYILSRDGGFIWIPSEYPGSTQDFCQPDAQNAQKGNVT